MASVSGAGSDVSAPPAGPQSPGAALRIVEWDGSFGSAAGAAQEELARLFRAPWHAAAVYAAAGAVFAAVMTAGWLAATRDEAIPVTKLALLFWTYLWPSVL